MKHGQIKIKLPAGGAVDMSLGQKRDCLANVIGNRFCIAPVAVRRWMGKTRTYSLTGIIDKAERDFG